MLQYVLSPDVLKRGPGYEESDERPLLPTLPLSWSCFLVDVPGVAAGSSQRRKVNPSLGFLGVF